VASLLGVDVGGTFTDLVLLAGDEVLVHKLPSSPGDPATAVLQGLTHLGQPVDAVRHGTTVATNAVLERRGARTALLVTAGFRDLLFVGRQNRAALYDLAARRPAPLVPRSLVVEVAERFEHSFALRVPWSGALGEAVAAFHAAHDARFGYALRGRPVEVVTLRLRAVHERGYPLPSRQADLHAVPPARLAPAAVYFAASGANRASAPAAPHAGVPVVWRAELVPGEALAGPALVAQMDSTTAVPPGWRATVDAARNLLLSRL
jgi:N-methylhydantoinase A/oxoprolinase/acetone carboxylase beta subunit